MRALLCLLALAAVPAFAVEQKDIVKIAEKWAVVGVIAGTDPKGHDVGIAVLRNQQTKHTYTLAIGDAVPNEFGYVLKGVLNRNVVLANGAKTVTLGFAEAASSASGSGSEEARENRTARFIDNYYRGLSDAPIEIFRDGRDRDEGAVDGDATAPREKMRLPLRRFGNYKEEAARSRFDFYRNDSGYGDGGSVDAGDGGGFLVNFSDSFQDEGRDAPADGSLGEAPYDADTIRDATPSEGPRDISE